MILTTTEARRLRKDISTLDNWRTWNLTTHNEAPIQHQASCPIKPKCVIWSNEIPYKAYYLYSTTLEEAIKKATTVPC